MLSEDKVSEEELEITNELVAQAPSKPLAHALHSASMLVGKDPPNTMLS